MRRTDEHIGNKVGLPCYLHHETYLHARVDVGAAERVYHVDLLRFRKLVGNTALAVIERFAGTGTIDGAVPPKGIAGYIVFHDELVLGRTPGELARVNSRGTAFR